MTDTASSSKLPDGQEPELTLSSVWQQTEPVERQSARQGAKNYSNDFYSEVKDLLKTGSAPRSWSQSQRDHNMKSFSLDAYGVVRERRTGLRLCRQEEIASLIREAHIVDQRHRNPKETAIFVCKLGKRFVTDLNSNVHRYIEMCDQCNKKRRRVYAQPSSDARPAPNFDKLLSDLKAKEQEISSLKAENQRLRNELDLLNNAVFDIHSTIFAPEDSDESRQLENDLFL